MPRGTRTRRRRLRRRRRNRRIIARPGPVQTRVVNLASVSSGPRKVARILDASLTRQPVPDLVMAVECGDLTLAKLVDPQVWHVVQLGRSISDPGQRIARSGCALIVRRGVVHLDRIRLRVGSPAGGGIRTRYTLKARATMHPRTPASWRTRVAVGHAPPRRAPRGRARFMAALDRIGGVKAGDFNLRSGVVRRLLGLRTRSVGVLHLTAPWWIPLSRVRSRDVGSDHRTVDVTLWPRRLRRARRDTLNDAPGR